MKNKKAEAVIKSLEEANETFTIKVLGDEQNKIYALSILMKSQDFRSFKKNEYVGIHLIIINLLKEAEIKFKILE